MIEASGRGPRRRAPRLPIQVRGSLAGRVAREISLVDLSTSGCLVRCGARLDHGAILDLSLDLEDGPLVVKVRVTETCLDGESAAAGSGGSYLAGLEFLAMPPRDAERLRRLLDDERRKRSADKAAR
jgi:hypothetical protein